MTAMEQYQEIKKKYQDAILFFRMGDFYEMFYEDAVLAARELEIALTSRSKVEKVPMCGVPYHAVDGYIDKLVGKGYKVAICEQLSDPKAKGIVERDVVRIVTPGTVIDSGLLQEKDNNFLTAIYQYGDKFGLGFVDITTGTLLVTEVDSEAAVVNELARYTCGEVLVMPDVYGNTDLMDTLRNRLGCYIECFSGAVDWEGSLTLIKDQFQTDDFSVLNLPGDVHIVNAVGLLLRYIEVTQKAILPHLRTVEFYLGNEYLDMDLFTRRNLELTETMRQKKATGSLLWVLDRTQTPMGGRMLRSWMERPLVNYIKIQNRLLAVRELVLNQAIREDIVECLKDIYDMERLIGRIASGRANCKDMLSLKQSLSCLPDLEVAMYQVQSGMVKDQCMKMDVLNDLYELLEDAIADDAPVSLKEGGIIKPGFDAEADEYRELKENGAQMVNDMEAALREETGIKGLKIGHNRVFGYYIEVSKAYTGPIPDTFMRKQTLVNGERYITPELKELESKILHAAERGAEREYFLFTQVRDELAKNVDRVQTTAGIVALMDCLCSLAEVAAKNNYCMPIVDTSDKIEIVGGRHPVVERALRGEQFVPNDTKLNLTSDRFLIVTGPNMAGKSTYMRQVAVIALMAQMGSFVPADSCHIGVVDKIFTRVGASDDLAAGQSTSMVEMAEMAYILDHATQRSLLLLDEIGRGTSTFDGLSIAWAVVEHVADKKRLGARTLFATHYHELTDLESRLEGVKNYCTTVKKRGDDITFLRRVVPGSADDSFGIEVAALAGVPSGVIKRAKEILAVLEENDLSKPDAKGKRVKQEEESPQLGLEDIAKNDVTEALRKLDLGTLTPIEALNKLYELQEML